MAGWDDFNIRDAEFDYNVDVVSPEDLKQNSFLTAPYMDRGGLSGSSMDSRQSTGSYPEPNYVASPLTSAYGSPRSDEGLTRRSSQYETSQKGFLSTDTAVPSRESSAGPKFLFNIERDGDPRIAWPMYYDFIVTKTDAYYQLQPFYLPTINYPPTRQFEKVIIIDGVKRHPCGVAGCKAKAFTRHYDLERHFITIHQADKKKSGEDQGSDEQINKEQGEKVLMKCDYKKCVHTALFRKDHCREHYREFHTEDLIKRGQPKHSKPKDNKKKPLTTEEFLASRCKNLHLGWWRCSKCIQRVQINPNGYMCPTCNLACEPQRVTCRENERMRKDKARNSANNSSDFGSAQMNSVVTNCGQCENTWLPDENDERLWVSCPQCRPGVRETMRV